MLDSIMSGLLAQPAWIWLLHLTWRLDGIRYISPPHEPDSWSWFGWSKLSLMINIDMTQKIKVGICQSAWRCKSTWATNADSMMNFERMAQQFKHRWWHVPSNWFQPLISTPAYCDSTIWDSIDNAIYSRRWVGAFKTVNCEQPGCSKHNVSLINQSYILRNVNMQYWSVPSTLALQNSILAIDSPPQGRTQLPGRFIQ